MAVGRRTVVVELEFDFVGSVSDAEVRTGRSGVADDVRQCFLDDAIGRDVDALGKGSDVPGDIDVDVDAGLAGLVDKVVELSEAWCRFELSFAGFVGLAEDADEATHLAQRSSTG